MREWNDGIVERLSELESEKPHEKVVGRTVGASNNGMMEYWNTGILEYCA